MSGLVGVLHLDHKPADSSLLATMLNAMAHRAIHELEQWNAGPVGLGHAALRTTPESVHEQLPWTDTTRGLTIVSDVRLDNREKLCDQLRLFGTTTAPVTDSALILAAYAKWGENCPGKLLGDFTFAIWDHQEQRLFCARDQVGIKPLYYYFSPSRLFLVSTELSPLVYSGLIALEPNLGMVGEYLTRHGTNQTETLYQSIFRLPPAHSCTVGMNGLTLRRYWQPDLDRRIVYKSDMEYAEHFRELFRDAVRVRLRSRMPVGLQLSGGVDSSSVVGMAQSLGAEPGVVESDTFSLVFPGEECDERDYIDAVNQMWELQGNCYTPTPPGPEYYSAYVNRHCDLPEYPNVTMNEPMYKGLQAHGMHVMLTGFGGDDWFTGSTVHYADLLRSFAIRQLIQQVHADHRYRGEGQSMLPHLLRSMVWPLVPYRLRRQIGWYRHPIEARYPFVNQVFARQIGLRQRLEQISMPAKVDSYTQMPLYQHLYDDRLSHPLEMVDKGASRYGLELRHPFCDRRIIEFSLALPGEQRQKVGATKYVMRRAMRELLPPSIYRRSSKANFTTFVAKTIENFGTTGLFEDLKIADMQWINAEAAVSGYRQMVKQRQSNDPMFYKHLWSLTCLMGMELWFRSLNRQVAFESRMDETVALPASNGN